jgi:hypothetical protein
MHLDEKKRAAETEALFREVNERIAETAERLEVEEPEFVCECADPACADRVAAPAEVYEDVRADGATFLLAPGHEDERFERVVRRRRGYRVVEKVREVAAIVRRLDPRASEA